jgi:hypothetical protein
MLATLVEKWIGLGFLLLPFGSTISGYLHSAQSKAIDMPHAFEAVDEWLKPDLGKA